MADLTVDSTVKDTYSAAARAAPIGTQKAALLNSFRDSVGTGWKFRVREVGFAVDRILLTGPASKIPIVNGKLVFTLPDVTVTTLIDTTFSSGSWVGQILDSSNNIIAYGTFGTAGTDFIISGNLVAASGLNGVTIELNPDANLDAGYSHVLAINCGSNSDYTTAGGITYVADILVSGGTQSSTVPTAIANTTDDTLYQKERFGVLTYTIPVTNNKNYRVTLKLAEIYSAITANGQRVFDVVLQQGTAQATTISGIDIFQSVGQFTALDITRDILVTNGTITITTVAGSQNPKLSAIWIQSSDGGVYIPPVSGGGGGGSGTTFSTPKSTVLDFKRLPHPTKLGEMPGGFSQAYTGRYYTEDIGGYGTTRKNLSAQLVPWFTIHAAYPKAWPVGIGVEVGYTELWTRTTAGVWALKYSWPTVTPGKGKQVRDDFDYLGTDEARGADNVYANFARQSADGTMIFMRTPSADFPTKGTNIHCYWEGPNATPYGGAGQISVDRSDLSNLCIRCKVRAVNFPSTSGQAVSTNPSWDETSIIMGLAFDAWNNGTILYDIGIGRHVYVTNSWQDLYFFTALEASMNSSPPPGVI